MDIQPPVKSELSKEVYKKWINLIHQKYSSQVFDLVRYCAFDGNKNLYAPQSLQAAFLVGQPFRVMHEDHKGRYLLFIIALIYSVIDPPSIN